jgi:hypothetical protein
MHITIRSFVVLVVLVVALAAAGCRKDSTEPLPPSQPIPAEQLRETDVLPHLEGPIVEGRNYLYCATFQLAWNKLQDTEFKEPIHLAGSPPMAEALLRGSKLNEDILPPDFYLVTAGLVKDGVVGKIRAEMRDRFPDALIHLPEHLDEQSAIAYAYLQCTLKFKEAFDRLKEPLVFQSKNGPVKVASFGVRSLKSKERDIALEKQVSILARVSDDDFVLRLNTTSEDDELILAKVKPEGTLAATVTAVRKRIKRRDGLHDDEDSKLLYGESLVVPIIDANIWRKYTELEGHSLTNPHWSKVIVAIAEQGIRFRLDENGAKLESKSMVTMTSSGREKPAQYIFDRPFLLMLKRKSCDQPYLAIWVETPELLKYKEN